MVVKVRRKQTLQRAVNLNEGQRTGGTFVTIYFDIAEFCFVLFCFFSLLADHERHDDLIALFFDQNYVSLETTLGQHNFI